jgi:ketosteroid isomerase-like protein
MIRKALLLTILLAAGLQAQAPVQDVIDAELAFARFTGEQGIKEGFLSFLAADSIVFRPGPVSGREVYSRMPASAAYLSWYPVAADRAASGELGYTTGPYEYFNSKSDKTAAACGHYVTLWRKQADGAWRVELDAGVSHAALPVRPPVLRSGATAGPEALSGGAAVAEKEVAALEKSLNEDYVRKIGALLAPEARAYRGGQVPAVGPSNALALIARGPGRWTFSPARTIAAGSGDFAYVYGTAERRGEGPGAGSPEGYAFLRIWKKAPGTDWRVLLDLAASPQK